MPNESGKCCTQFNFFGPANPIEIPPHLLGPISNSQEGSAFSSYAGHFISKDMVGRSKGGHSDTITLFRVLSGRSNGVIAF